MALTPQEQWKSIDGFPLYDISSFGRVRSCARTFQRPNRSGVGWDTVTLGEKIIGGYARRSKASLRRPSSWGVSIRRNGKTFQMKVHQLVLAAFVGPRPAEMEGCHNDGNVRNNTVTNLRWDTHKNNVHDCIAHGTKNNPPIHWGESHHNATLTDVQVFAVRQGPYYHGIYADLGRQYSTSGQTIRRIRDGLTRRVQ